MADLAVLGPAAWKWLLHLGGLWETSHLWQNLCGFVQRLTLEFSSMAEKSHPWQNLCGFVQ